MRRILQVAAQEVGIGRFHLRLLLAQALVALLPYLAAMRLRTALYRLAGFSIGRGTLISGSLRLWGTTNVAASWRVGRSCFINAPCAIDLNAPVTFGDRVVIGFGVTIITGSHQMHDPDCRAGALVARPVTIEDGAWVAANAILLPGVTIGAGAVVGAGSVVTRDVAPHTLVAGNPARFVRTLKPAASAAAAGETNAVCA